MDPAPTFSAPETILANLGMILRGLLAGLGAWRLEPVLALVVYRRIGRTMGQIERMLMRFRAGRLWRLTHRVTAAGRQARKKAELALPRRFGWLVQAGGYQAACVGSQLQAAVNSPEMAELLVVSAQARRILQPLCRALAVELPGIAATACGDRTPRRCRPRVVAEPFRIPLPRGVLAAARREGFGKIG